MTRLATERARLREQAEHHLRIAAMEDLRRRHPQATTAPHKPRGGYFWRLVFVPLYRRVPWEISNSPSSIPSLIQAHIPLKGILRRTKRPRCQKLCHMTHSKLMYGRWARS